ncbi:hypothetical protein BS78_K335200 [Paspalum vaginatum]|uniref:Uncharacterized protein n=1 Tax=Paspalum vaginatum TaxID=158149 RepID=A0A9W7XAZ6_9POAL|nr:hypothetical protein BS78_K335200 [Paspalum vaginatum]KAJ1256681.1 hypothetical protein BS78_K335200 [Paspalum vaginatum]KAJ1256682.1 hypothetical protein BS78_K335200 [Paspalum vaginatum]
MADLVTGAMSSIIPKLGELLKEEYNLQTRVKERIRSLTLELEGAKGALDKVAEVPWDQLDKQVKFWVREVRESSYDMEGVLDTYLVHVQGRDSAKQKSLLERFCEKIGNLFKKSKARRKISVSGKDIMTHLHEVTERCRRYRVDNIIASRTATSSTVDPRLSAMYNKVKDLIGIDKSSSELISMLHPLQRGSVLNANAKMKIVSVVGVGGLGKTTLAKAVFDKHKGDFDRGAFVPVGRNPDLKKVFQQILIGLDKERYMQFYFGQFSEIYQFIDELKGFLQNKRYFIFVDDVWETQSWDTIKLAIDDENNCGSRIIVTTRKMDVATKAGVIYKLQPLSDDSSKVLFYTRMYGDEGSCVDNKTNGISNKILKKCGGIPLAIITMASLLADKPNDRWAEIYKTIGFGHKDSKEDENTTMRILCFSYYDLPSHLRTCLLYLGAFREDSIINKSALIWMWIAEGFIHEQQGTWLFETGEGYFNDLINRSLIQGLDGGIYGPDSVIVSCSVHDVVLDFIRFMLHLHEENFSTILDTNGKDTPSRSPPVRRLVHHNRTMRHTTTHQANNQFNDKMRTVRSFSAQGCAVESWTLLSRFTLLRVLAIEECNPVDGCRLRVEHVGNLLHLRYLSLSGTRIQRITEEIGGLRFLQTLDLLRSGIEETPSGSSLPTQLVCLRITFDLSSGPADNNGEVGWVGRLTSLEELLIHERYQWKEIGSLRELRVLNASIDMDDDESMRDFVDSISHLNKLQHLEIRGSRFQIVEWEATRFVLLLPRQLRYFNGMYIIFPKMPPCINPCGLPNLSRLYLSLRDMDEQDLENLGGLPELRFLGLDLTGCSATINNINDSKNVVYFPKLRYFQLWGAMVLLFVVNKKEEDNKKVVSFHLWDGCSDDMPVTFDSNDDHGQQMPMPIPLFDFEGNDHDNRESSIFIGNEGTTTAPRLRFMPSLQVIKFEVRGKAPLQNHRYCDNLGLEYLSSLREIRVRIYKLSDADAANLEKVEAALRRATDEHPNRPNASSTNLVT